MFQIERTFQVVCLVAVFAVFGSVAMADSFGTGGNAFDIDFVPISGDASSANGTAIGTGKTFSDPGNDYRMGTREITNDQWDKFVAAYGTVTGAPSNAYDESFDDWGTGTTNVPTNRVSWYEAAQMVNWLNTSTNHQAAYKFTGTQGQSDYALDTWSAAEADGGTNLYRHKDAFYYMPTEDEWVKAAYWNGATIQDYATKAGDTLAQGDGTSGVGWNYYDNGYATDPHGPWDVGSGSEELNGTHDMMGNVWEWMESPYNDPSYGDGSSRGLRGGSFYFYDYSLASSDRYPKNPYYESSVIGFRVASEVPEPCSLGLLALGGLAVLRRRSR